MIFNGLNRIFTFASVCPRNDIKQILGKNFNGPFTASFSFIFVFSTVDSRYVNYKILAMTGFEMWDLWYMKNIFKNLAGLPFEKSKPN